MKAKKRLDYTPSKFSISNVNLDITLEPLQTRVESELLVVRNGDHSDSLVLDGEDLHLESVQVDGQIYDNYRLIDGGIELFELPDAFSLTIVNGIDPAKNKALEGLYMANSTFCTQCEAEGFRRITYFLDRPDILATYTVTLHADAELYPYLLANGNKLSEVVEDGKRTVVWSDPFPKPCYLFALVAGDFDLLEDTFVTASGRNVALQLFVDKGQLNKACFAMQALQRSMRWDEETFGLEYDLDIYMIVAVDFFNMGAMENKGLNVFNSKFILANNDTATDTDYFNIEAVVAHEYFHNWTGNRVTCRDWFQLSLKEGLTVFRDQLFSADMTSELSTRIDQVKLIKEHQFPEDMSAMSHPIRPDEVVEMNNFYTVTVYDKGAEVIRLLRNIVGDDAFKQGLKTYFQRHDGQAVTCDDFVAAIQSATATDLSKFKRWYEQSGTPILSVNEDKQLNSFKISQTTPPTADQSSKQALSLLLNYQCYDLSGQPLELETDSESLVSLGPNKLLFEGETATLRLPEHTSIDNAIITLLGNFSSPIKLEQSVTPVELSIIVKHDNDAFNRWDAIQQLFSIEVSRMCEGKTDISIELATTVNYVFENISSSIEQAAEFLNFPSIESLIQSRTNVDIHQLTAARTQCVRALAYRFYSQLSEQLDAIPNSSYCYTQEQVAYRRLRQSLLSILAFDKRSVNVIEQVYQRSDNMTDTLAALNAAQIADGDLFAKLMQDFELKWREDSLVMDKWFALHATDGRSDILTQLSLLQQHPRFDATNPNRVRSLIGSFAFYNKPGFHNSDYSGYRYLTDYLLQLDAVNPQVAARIVTPLTQFQNLCSKHQQGMRAQLSRLLNHKNLSKDMFEKVSKALAYESAL